MTNDRSTQDEKPTSDPKADDPRPNIEGVMKAITGSNRERGIQLSEDESGEKE